MKYTIRGEKIEVTEAIKEYIIEKLSKIDKYFDNPEEVTANVLVRVKNREQKVEVTINTSLFQIRAEESHSDLYAAIDLVSDKVERQIRKNKTKLNNKYKNIVKLDINTDFEISKDEESDKKILRRKNIDTKPMDEEEAILQMELVNHDFFVFKNIEEECVSVVYKRTDGNFGVINVK